MTDDRKPFKQLGRMTIREACMKVIRQIQPKDGITYDQAVDDVRELTGLDYLDLDGIRGLMGQASKELRRLGEPGLRNRRKIGWERETPEQMVAAGEHHERKGRRQVRWAVEAVAAAPVEALSWDARARRENLLERNRKVTELEERRAQRRRPLPPTGT